MKVLARYRPLLAALFCAPLGGLIMHAQGPGSGPVQQIVAGPGLDIDPAFSPDHKSIVYASSRGGSLEIWMRPVAGGGLYQLTTSAAASADRYPVLTPDGKALVFQSDRVNGTRNIWWMALDNRGLVQLTNFTDGGASHPAIAPDGKAICFTRTNATGALSIWVIDVNGRGARELAAGIDCAWTTTGRIVFAQGSGGDNATRYDIAIMNSDGRGVQILVQAPQVWLRGPVVSPDGKALVYTAYPGPFGGDIQEVAGGMQIDPRLRTSLWVVNLNVPDRPPRELVSATSFNSYAAWSHDSRTVTFTSNRSGSADIWAIEVNQW
jgi:Tol biopolymer transport system component